MIANLPVQRPAPNGRFLLLGLLVMIVASILFAAARNSHAYTRHGEIIFTIQDFCREKGPYQVWRDRYDKGVFFLICKKPDSEDFGVWVVRKIGDKLVEKTVFAPGQQDNAFSTWNQILKYLTEKGATRFTGPMPPMP